MLRKWAACKLQKPFIFSHTVRKDTSKFLLYLQEEFSTQVQSHCKKNLVQS